MTARLPTHVTVGALLRRVNDAGGLAVVRARGDADAGGLLIVVEGNPPGVLERRRDLDDRDSLFAIQLPDGERPDDYWQRRRSRDPDLWVVELDIAGAERFAAETIAPN